MLLVPPAFFMPVSVAPGTPVATYVGRYASPTISGSTATFAGIVIPSGGLLVVRASIYSGSSRTISTVTVDGTGAAIAAASAANATATAIAARSVSAGTFDIVVTASGSITYAAIDVTVISGLSSTTPIDTDSVASSGSGTNRTLTLTTGAIGFWVDAHGNTSIATWTGSGLVIDNNEAVSATYAHSSATYQASADGDKNAATTWSGSVSRSMCAGAWR